MQVEPPEGKLVRLHGKRIRLAAKRVFSREIATASGKRVAVIGLLGLGEEHTTFIEALYSRLPSPTANGEAQ